VRVAAAALGFDASNWRAGTSKAPGTWLELGGDEEPVMTFTVNCVGVEVGVPVSVGVSV
jgi:hypothetical protein